MDDRGREVAVWRGQDTSTFTPVAYDLDPHKGKTLHVEVTDTATGPSESPG